MTRPHISNTCDLCQNEIESDEMSYKTQFNQIQPYTSGSTKGKFVSSTNKADLCKKCFLKFCEGNFSVKWKTMQKIGDSWQEVDPQEKILEV